MEPKPIREFSSLRDPSGFVFYFEGGVYRALNNQAYTDLTELRSLGILDRLIDNMQVVRTNLTISSTEKVQLFKEIYPENPHFIEHDPIFPLSTPAEWTRSMLCDAALLELDLQRELIEAGFMLKDATAYNVQYKNTQPLHIDLSSIEKKSGGLWPAYGQFCRMFVFPLLLNRYKKFSLKSYFLTYLSGIELDSMFYSIGFLCALRPSVFSVITMPFFLQRLFRKKSLESLQFKVERHQVPLAALKVNIQQLSKLIISLRNNVGTPPSVWDGYMKENLYTPSERSAKKEAVRRLLEKIKPNFVLDLGSNTGEYSILAAEYAQRVIAVEADHESLDQLYNEAKRKKLPIQCIWTDLLNPTPAIGFCNKERVGFHDRVKGDVVMALALVHHLITASNFPLREIAGMLFGLTKTHLLVEFVSPNDPQFKSLVGLRANLYEGLTETVFEQIFSEYGQKVESVRLNDFRTIYLFVKN